MTLVRYESQDHVATITMDRASAHNALNNTLVNELREAWRHFRDSDDRVAVLAFRLEVLPHGRCEGRLLRQIAHYGQ